MCVGGGGVGVLDSRHNVHVILTHNKKREKKKILGSKNAVLLK